MYVVWMCVVLCNACALCGGVARSAHGFHRRRRRSDANNLPGMRTLTIGRRDAQHVAVPFTPAYWSHLRKHLTIASGADNRLQRVLHCGYVVVRPSCAYACTCVLSVVRFP